MILTVVTMTILPQNLTWQVKNQYFNTVNVPCVTVGVDIHFLAVSKLI